MQQPPKSLQAGAAIRSAIFGAPFRRARVGYVGIGVYIFGVHELAVPRLGAHETLLAATRSGVPARSWGARFAAGALPAPQAAIHQPLLHRQRLVEQDFRRTLPRKVGVPVAGKRDSVAGWTTPSLLVQARRVGAGIRVGQCHVL